MLETGRAITLHVTGICPGATVEQLHLVPILFFPSDTSLTCSNIRAALRTVDEKTLSKGILVIGAMKRKELKEQSVECDYREQIITYYLQSSPYASWEHIIGGLLLNEEDAALHEVKQFLQPDEGTKYSEL